MECHFTMFSNGTAMLNKLSIKSFLYIIVLSTRFVNSKKYISAKHSMSIPWQVPINFWLHDNCDI